MNNLNRNLLVLFNQEMMSPQAMEHEVDILHKLLYNVERSDSIIITHEVIDLNKYKVINNPIHLRKIIRQKELKAFVFLNNKN
jgi:hypothetical protein